MSDIEHLLQPTITEDEDLGVMQQPWNPAYLLILTFFCGFHATGWFIASNCARLGIARRAAALRIVTVFYTLALFSAFGYFDWRAAQSGAGATEQLLARVRENLGPQAEQDFVATLKEALHEREPNLIDAELERRAEEISAQASAPAKKSASRRPLSGAGMDKKTGDLLKYSSQGLGVLVGALLMRSHFRRFRIAQMQSVATGRFWPVVLLAILTSTVLGFGLVGVMMLIK